MWPHPQIARTTSKSSAQQEIGDRPILDFDLRAGRLLEDGVVGITHSGIEVECVDARQVLQDRNEELAVEVLIAVMRAGISRAGFRRDLA